MNGTLVDTLELFDGLKESFSEEQAHTLSRVLRRVEESRMNDMATKRDLVELATKRDLAELETRLIKWMFGMSATIVGLVFAMLRFMPPAG